MSLRNISLQEAALLVNDGNSIAIGGDMHTAPMALVRALVRRGAKDLRVITTPTGGINVDMLIGAGAVASVEFAQMSFGEHGMAPNFRRWVESGRLVTRDHT